MTTPNDRARYLDTCDAALADKPRLAAVFDLEWREAFSADVVAQPCSAVVGYPTAYWLPMLYQHFPEMHPEDIQHRIERGLDLL